MKHVAVIGVLLALVSCGGSSGTPTQPGGSTAAPMQVSETYTGTTVQTGTGSCTGDSHNLTTAAGDMSVRLISTSDPAGALSIQVCSGGIDNNQCSINQQKIAVNQTITGSRRGDSLQNLKLLPHNCVFGGAPLGTPVSYSVSITYWK
jgi:hypothetical protein